MVRVAKAFSALLLLLPATAVPRMDDKACENDDAREVSSNALLQTQSVRAKIISADETNDAESGKPGGKQAYADKKAAAEAKAAEAVPEEATELLSGKPGGKQAYADKKAAAEAKAAEAVPEEATELLSGKPGGKQAYAD